MEETPARKQQQALAAEPTRAGAEAERSLRGRAWLSL
ncbi:hypothetical protein PF003_g40507 [Phytophthora fragariae]|nr:hypothetical protein PF003_g40507 [Phytophthora fragariae]